MMRIVLLALTLIGGSPLRLSVAPPPELRAFDYDAVGLTAFDLEIAKPGQASASSLVYGQPPFVERSRLAFKDWEFDGVGHASATFLHKTTPALPDSTIVVDIPLPGEEVREHPVPFPIRISEPGYPIDGMGEGAVIMQVDVTPKGNAGDIRVVRDVPTLTPAATAAVRQWKFFVPPGTSAPVAIVGIFFRSPRL